MHLNISKTQRQQKQSHEKHVEEMNFEIGQKVWMFNTRLPRDEPYKLNSNRWQGPREEKAITSGICRN